MFSLSLADDRFNSICTDIRSSRTQANQLNTATVTHHVATTPMIGIVIAVRLDRVRRSKGGIS